MTVAFFWCHTEGCPNYGRARKMERSEFGCPSCGAEMKIAAPGELPSVGHELDEQNQIQLTEEDLSEG